MLEGAVGGAAERGAEGTPSGENEPAQSIETGAEPDEGDNQR